MGKQGDNYTEFVCKEPRNVIISCSKKQWSYLSKHKEMEGQQGVVKAVIEKPDFICQSRDFKNRNTFYKRLVMASVGDTYIRVVVEYRGKLLGKRGYMINAFPCGGMQEGEVIIWEKKN